MLIKMGNLLVSQDRLYMNTDAGERFPVRIAFTRRISETELRQLTAFAYLIETGNIDKAVVKNGT